MSDRQTGRTREQLRACLTAALDGKVVAYVVHSDIMMRYARDLLVTLGKAQRVMRDRVEYESGGCVKFIVPPRDERGFWRARGFDAVAHDHAYWDHRP